MTWFPRSHIPMHRPSAIFWAAWLVGVVGLWAWNPDFLVWQIWLSLFVPGEGQGFIRKRMSKDGKVLGDTLSELMQHIASWAKDGSAWWQSWNIVPVACLALITWTTFYVVSHSIGGDVHRWEFYVAGAITGLGVWFLNIYHWLNRGKHG